MKLTWLGTAGFWFNQSDFSFLIDPFISRNAQALPKLKTQISDLSPIHQIFISHGHFDHLMDVPYIAKRTRAKIYCSKIAAKTLLREGILPSQISYAEPGTVIDFGSYQAVCIPSHHVRFDIPLLLKTLMQAGTNLFSLYPLFKHWPKGQVFSWRFIFKNRPHKVFHHIGSAGCTQEEIQHIKQMGSIDVLMLPLQGHTRICDLTIKIAEHLAPKTVIAHHYDDFYPPISQFVDINPFKKALQELQPPIHFLEIKMGEVVSI